MTTIDGLSADQEKHVGEIMQAHGFDSLKRTQQLAFEDGILDDGNHLLVADTGNGKTLCAESVTKQELERGGRIAYLVPSRQLVRDKRDSIREWAQGYNVKSGRGKYNDADVIVATFDSFYRAILRNTGNASSLDLVVLDDFHEIYGSYRGPEIEKAIGAAMYEDIEMFAMSATLGNPHELGEWLNADVTISPEGRQIHIEETAVEITQSSKKEAVADFVENQKSKAPFLIFNYAKSWTSSRAQTIADRGTFDDANDKAYLSEMRNKVDGELTDRLEQLAEMMSHGVAYHHADLPPQIKEWIEELYDEGEIQCLCATTTIAYGFDAPVQTVVVADIKRRSQWVGVWEYVQWIGRAARPGYGYDKGYAYTLTNDVDRARQRYFSPHRELEPVTTHIENEALFRKLFLELVETGWQTPEQIEAFVQETLFWSQLEEDGAWGRGFGSKADRVRDRLRSTASWLEHHDFLREVHTQQAFQATTMGGAAVEFLFDTFSSHTLTEIKEFYNRIGKQDLTRLSLLNITGRVFDQTLGERKTKQDIATRLQAEDIPVDDAGITAGILHWYWCQNWSTNDVERETGIDATYLSTNSRRLAQTLSSTEVLFDANPHTMTPQWFDTYTTRVERGIRHDEVPFVTNIRGFGRYRARMLRDYLDSVKNQQSLPDGTLWTQLRALYENIDDENKFNDVLRSNVTGIGSKTADRITELVADDAVDEAFKSESADADAGPSTGPTTLDDWD